MYSFSLMKWRLLYKTSVEFLTYQRKEGKLIIHKHKKIMLEVEHAATKRTFLS